jgi:homoserine/homoserine lactone efflux protein
MAVSVEPSEHEALVKTHSTSACCLRPSYAGLDPGASRPAALASVALHTWLIYLLAAIGLSLSPGPNGLLALTHGALHGRRKALYTIFGGAVGFVAIIALSMFGIGALLKASLTWLTVMKWVGGAYLVWLGIQIWRSPPIGIEVRSDRRARSGASLFRQGALSALTNPKGILFFAAFLPQFIDPDRSLLGQFIVMAATFAATEIATEILVACMAHRISPWLRRVGRRFNQACGGLFVAIGVALPLRG